MGLFAGLSIGAPMIVNWGFSIIERSCSFSKPYLTRRKRICLAMTELEAGTENNVRATPIFLKPGLLNLFCL